MDKNYILIGLPGSGKTTYLAVLWHTVHSCEIENSLQLRHSPDEMDYLNEIRDKWLNFEEITRSGQSGVKSVIIYATINENEPVNLFIPDFTGEVLKDIFESRTVDKDILKYLNMTDGTLFFINPDIEYPISISEANEALGITAKEFFALRDEKKKKEDSGENKNETEAETQIPFDIEKVPTQIIIVDLLQILYMFKQKKEKIAFIISAWDKISAIDSSITPEQWIKKECPLLDQFLNSNKNNFEFNIYGISAQGGDYATDSDILMKFKKATDRVIVKDNKSVSHDIAIPIKWLLSDE